ncbi:MAG: putative immunity protein [Candidatus Bathyarchaeales archaeon]
MQHTKQERIKVTLLLYTVRKAVSEIFGVPFTERINHQAFKPVQKILAFWAADCAEHVLNYFEEKYLNDDRPRKAIEACRKWAATGALNLAEIRKFSLDAHAAAKTAKEDDAKYAAHAAGQAVATAHCATHSLGAAIYGIRAAAVHSSILSDGLVKEFNWQMERLRQIKLATSQLV